MGTIAHVLRKEFLQLRRDRRMLPIVFISPILQLVLLGYAANLDVREIPTVVCDLDRSAQSRDLLSDFFESGYFTRAADAAEMDGVDLAIDRDQASVGIIIPRRFGADLLAGRRPEVLLVSDGSESSTATISLGYAEAIVGRFSSLATSPAAIRVESRVWYNPELRSRYFMVPGILALLLMVLTMLLTSLAVVKEREIGTLEQLIVTPIRPAQLILGKLAPFAIIGIVDAALVILVAVALFGVPLRGSVALLFLLSGVFLLTTLGLGLLISTISRTQQQAMMTAIFFFMMPMIMLSGFVFPIENMPPPIRLITYLLPLRYYFHIVRGVFLKGAGLRELWPQASALLGFGVAILGASALRFRKRLE